MDIGLGLWGRCRWRGEMECIFCGYLDSQESFVVDEKGLLRCPSCGQWPCGNEEIDNE